MFRARRILICVAILVVATIVSGFGFYARASAPKPEREIQITAKMFDFSPGVITVKKGEPVVFVISSKDRKHGFNLRAFGIRTDINAGSVARIRFTPDKTGKFNFTCDVFCGEGHEEMSGTLIVTE